MWDYNGWWQYGMGFGFHWLPGIAVWGVLIWALVVMWRRGVARVPATAADSREKGLAVLNERYARGEVGREEFLAMRRDIGQRAKTRQTVNV